MEGKKLNACNNGKPKYFFFSNLNAAFPVSFQLNIKMSGLVEL